METPILEIKNLRKVYANAEPIKDISLTVHKGEVVSIIGPSGTGKSTLLRCINRIEKPSSGQIYIKGKLMNDDPSVIRSIRQEIGMVFQSFNLFSNLNVMDNITLGPTIIKKMSKEEAQEKAVQLLEIVGLAGAEKKWPDELSGGQKQRVAIARALAMEPELMLFDEPTSALDPRMIDEVLYVIKKIASEGNTTMLLVTHEMRFAEAVSTRVIFLNNGTIQEDGTPIQIFHNPQNQETKDFIFRLSNYERVFVDRNIDYLKTIQEINDFANRMFFSRKTNVALQQIFEETIIEMLLHSKQDVFPINYKIANGEDCAVEINFKGERNNPIETDTTSSAILKAITKDYQYEYKDETNHLYLTV